MRVQDIIGSCQLHNECVLSLKSLLWYGDHAEEVQSVMIMITRLSERPFVVEPSIY